MPTQFKFNWLPAAGTLLIIAGLISMVILKVSPAEAFKTYARDLRRAALRDHHRDGGAGARLRDEPVGQTASLGAWLAGDRRGVRDHLADPRLDRVAVTGSDTSSNSLFGALQVQAAAKAGLDPVLMAAANSSGGVLGKMVSPQNLAIAAAAVAMAGQEGVIFRKVIGWSLLMLLLMCVIVGLQSTPVLDWMVP